MASGTTERYMVSPFAGEPYTSSTLDEHGNPAMTVTICEITPEDASSADNRSVFCTFIFFVLSFFFLVYLEASSLFVWVVALFTPFVAYSEIKEYFYRTMTTITEVMFTLTEFRVKSGDAWQVYDRTLTHRFVMMKHDRTREEQENHELLIRRAQRRGTEYRPKRYYSESFHIIFDYLGQRFDVASVYNQKRATAVATRLKACDKVMDTKNRMGEGEALNPSQQWGAAPGTLPDI